MGRLLIQFPGTTTAKALTETLSKNVIIVDEDLHQLRLHDGSTAGGHLIGGSSGSGVPVGTIIPFAGNSIPQGYLLCDGSAISRTTYASLFAVIGTIYGTGDGNSTFNLPNFVDRYKVSSGSTTNNGWTIRWELYSDGWIIYEIFSTASLGAHTFNGTYPSTWVLNKVTLPYTFKTRKYVAVGISGENNIWCTINELTNSSITPSICSVNYTKPAGGSYNIYMGGYIEYSKNSKSCIKY